MSCYGDYYRASEVSEQDRLGNICFPGLYALCITNMKEKPSKNVARILRASRVKTEKPRNTNRCNMAWATRPPLYVRPSTS